MREKIRLYNKRENTALQWAGKYGFTMGGNQRPGKVLTKTNLYGSIIVKLLLILLALFMFDEISVNWEKYWTYTLQYNTKTDLYPPLFKQLEYIYNLYNSNMYSADIYNNITGCFCQIYRYLY